MVWESTWVVGLLETLDILKKVIDEKLEEIYVPEIKKLQAEIQKWKSVTNCNTPEEFIN